MKRSIFVVLIFGFLFLGCVTTPPESLPNAQTVKIIDTGKPASDAFDLAMQWMNKSFVSAKNVIQYTDKVSGMITGKASMPISETFLGKVGIVYTMSIEIKDSKARIIVDPVEMVTTLYDPRYAPTIGPLNKPMLDKFKSQIETTISSLTSFIQNNTSNW
jgi:hypothetical protein